MYKTKKKDLKTDNKKRVNISKMTSFLSAYIQCVLI